MNSSRTLNESFANFIKNLLSLLSFDVIDEPKLSQANRIFRPDFLITRASTKALCDVKFYKSRLVNSELILQSALVWGHVAKEAELECLLIVSSVVPRAIKEQLKEKGIILWDRSNIANFLLAVNRDDLLVDLGQFITESQQGIDTSYPYEDIDEDTSQDPLSYFSSNLPQTAQPLNKGELLITELNEIPLGKPGWSSFERKCIEMLKYLFDADLSVWDAQVRTDDSLSRYDLISRIVAMDDFWRTLVQSFNSRYILFEFKNYIDPLPASQIYTTERYLYPKALRAVSMIIARKGASLNAVSAAKGALRENGKLILILNQEDLEEMLRRKDRGDSPSDYLSDKLDEHLISLSR